MSGCLENTKHIKNIKNANNFKYEKILQEIRDILEQNAEISWKCWLTDI